MTINKDLVFDTSEAQDPEKEIGDTALQTEGEFNVQVLQGEEIIAKKTFTAVLPSKITAEHEGRPVSGKDGEYGEGFPQDGDWVPAGASSVLNLTFILRMSASATSQKLRWTMASKNMMTMAKRLNFIRFSHH